MALDDAATPARAQIRPPDPSWQARGAALATQLHAALGPLALRVDHIGSTAIPGMAAKRVFDLQASVADLDEAAAAFDTPLAGLGFARRPYERDHVPSGRADDPARWAKRYWTRADPARDSVSLHVRVAGSPNERLALLFRDWFRAHPAAIPAYARFKLLLAAVVVDVDTYADIKDPVVDVVVEAAEEWATATGWSP
jgi:GrpB-like predicted nucleotidyltransferase (UPF0157 family)